jgi:hypothetical protein
MVFYIFGIFIGMFFGLFGQKSFAGSLPVHTSHRPTPLAQRGGRRVGRQFRTGYVSRGEHWACHLVEPRARRPD